MKKEKFKKNDQFLIGVETAKARTAVLESREGAKKVTECILTKI